MFKQRHKFYSQIDDELIDSEASIFRTQSSQDNQEIIEVIYWTKMEEKICYKLYCFYSTSSPFGLFHIEDSKSAKDMLMFKDNYIYISMTLALYLALSSNLIEWKWSLLNMVDISLQWVFLPSFMEVWYLNCI